MLSGPEPVIEVVLAVAPVLLAICVALTFAFVVRMLIDLRGWYSLKPPVNFSFDDPTSIVEAVDKELRAQSRARLRKGGRKRN